MKNKSKLSTILLIIAVILLVVVFFMLRNKKIEKTNPAVIYESSTDVVDPSDPTGNIHIYTSNKLGITFQYPHCNINTSTAVGEYCVSKLRNSVRIPPYFIIEGINSVSLSGDASIVKVFEKDSQTSLKDAILKLSNYYFDTQVDTQKCFLKSYAYNETMKEAFEFTVAHLTKEEVQELNYVNMYRRKVAQLCPKGFSDGHSWFMGNNLSTKFLYVIGQSSAQSFDEVTITPYPENKVWYNTIKFIK